MRLFGDGGRTAAAAPYAAIRHRPARRASRSARLIVVEDGTSGFETHVSPDGSDQTVVVAQNSGELPTQFALRTVRRILVLEQAHRSIARAILILAPRFDTESTAARVLFARALMTHSATTNAGASELVLSAGASLDACDEGLLSLIDVLVGEPGSCSLPVSIG